MSIGKESKANVAKRRQTVFMRDGETCIAKGVFGFCGGELTLQHRAGRGMGGSAKQDGFENLLTMCLIHNELETASADFHRVCVSRGWSMPRWAHDKGLADFLPAWFPGRGWFVLCKDGRVSEIDERAALTALIVTYGPGVLTELGEPSGEN